jgi:DUF1009 family protein
MGRRIGIIAGSGTFVSGVVSELRRRETRCVVLAIKGESSPRLAGAADAFLSVKPGELRRAVAFFKRHRVTDLLLLGKVWPGVVFRRQNFDVETWRRLEKIKDRSASGVLEAAIAFLEAQGFKVLSPAPFLAPHFYKPGVLTRSAPSPEVLEDIRLGLRVAGQLADLEIGQTLVVKGGVIVAVEGMEGTDRAILRGGRLAGPGSVVIKAGRTAQDMRVDVPAAGLDTVKALLRARGAALAIEAGKVALFQKEEAVSLADAHGASIVIQAGR